jgi:hypothetical protein
VLESLLQFALCIASAATAIHLLVSGLYRKYRFFFVYLVLRIPYGLAPFFFKVTSKAYFNIWFVAEPLFCLLYILIVLELYRLVLAKYLGLQTIGRWAMYVISVVAITISGLTLILKFGPETPVRSKKLFSVLAFQRGVDTTLVIFLVLMLLFLSRYPIRLSHNVRVYALVYPIFFMSNVFQALMFTLFDRRFGDTVNLAMSALSLASTLAFLVLLRRTGEEVPVIKSGITPEHGQVLLSQLDALNTTLLRVSRR